MKRLTILMALGALLLVCSNCSLFNKMNMAENVNKTASPINFTTLNNYFVRNDVDCSKLQRLILDNQADFEGFFGEAAHMGGRPTAVNWKTQYVLAVILPETGRETSIKPIAVKQDGSQVVLSYEVKRGDKVSYTMVPFTAVAVDKPDTNQQMEIFFLEK